MSYSSPPNIISTPNMTVGSFTGTTNATYSVADPISPTSLLVRGFILYNTSNSIIKIQTSGGVLIYAVDENTACPAFYFGSATVDLSKELFTLAGATEGSLAYTVVYWQ